MAQCAGHDRISSVMGWKERASWAALGVVIMAVIAGTVPIPEPVKQLAEVYLNGRAGSDQGVLFQGSEILPERSGLLKVPAPKDADIDAALYNTKRIFDSGEGDSTDVQRNRDPAS